MKLQHRIGVSAPAEKAWPILMDIRQMAACTPGAEAVVPLGEDRYRGRFRVGLGPIRLSLEGDLEVTERDDDARRAVLTARGADARLGGGVRALMEITVRPQANEGSEVVIDTDVQMLGRIGELGQPLMKRKADEVMRDFATNLAALIAADP